MFKCIDLLHLSKFIICLFNLINIFFNWKFFNFVKDFKPKNKYFSNVYLVLNANVLTSIIVLHVIQRHLKRSHANITYQIVYRVNMTSHITITHRHVFNL